MQTLTADGVAWFDSILADYASHQVHEMKVLQSILLSFFLILVKAFLSQAQEDFKKKWDNPSHVSDNLYHSRKQSRPF